ncbi:MAG: ATP-dependent Clp protease ATP-binding subunit ClpC [Verrucomicrobiales bacterium]|jgi:ATP-dependent Clp protease ATP-binding subunit ClpC
MELTLPVLVEKVQPEGERPFYRASAVFVGGYERVDSHEERAIRDLTDALRRSATEEAKAMRHDLLAGWSFYPPRLRHRRLDLTLTLRKHTLRTSIVVLMFDSLDRTLAASPQIREICFEIGNGESVETRAQEVFTEHFKQLEKEGADIAGWEFENVIFSRLDTISIQVGAKQRPPKEDASPMAFLGEDREISGSQELERTGRNLTRLYPNELNRALLRENETQQLLDWFRGRKPGDEAPPPLVIVGPNQVGKTTLIHEWIFRRCDGDSANIQVWLLSPQRLISGMSYVGQWEQRVLAILKEAEKQRYVVYFDDLLGLFHAGKSRDSNLTVGQVLKVLLEEGRLSVLGEATPEAWRKLRELDRSFADLFTVLHLREPDEHETLRILIRTLQDLEHQHGCRFSPEVLPLVIELPRRFVRGRAFPGKGAEMLRQLAATHPNTEISKAEAYQFFENKTGIRQRFMDREQLLASDAVRSFFQDRILGQKEATEAMVDSIVLTKAQLNDPTRPLASLLFLGPTGVGKTECAKALAEFYFGSSGRLLRFDMNEFNGWDAVNRLIGTFGGRQGILTSAVRRRPYAVILLDEIEKADPKVFDLLLQVLDDGRLTDANGITTDFCNSIVILTSNLGAIDAKRQVGFSAMDSEDTEIYRDAARNFFRPEFFNRLDKVVAFSRLGREHIEGIVRLLVSSALRRQGLHQRHLSLSVTPEVYDWLGERGFQKEYGARSLRRSVEDHLVEPLALELAKTEGRRPAFLRVEVHNGELRQTIHELTGATVEAPLPGQLQPRNAAGLARAANRFVRRIDEQMETWRDRDEERVTELDKHYFLVREELMRFREARDRFQNAADAAAQSGGRSVATPSRFGRQPKLFHIPRDCADKVLNSVFAGADSSVVLEKLAEESLDLNPLSLQAAQVIGSAARVEFLAHPKLATPARFLLRFRVSRADFRDAEVEGRYAIYKGWIQSYIEHLEHAPAVSKRVVRFDSATGDLETVSDPQISGFLSSEPILLYGEGPGFLQMLRREAGLELFCFSSQSFEFGGVEIIPLRGNEPIKRGCKRAFRSNSGLMEKAAKILRIRHETGWVLDLKSGILTQNPMVALWNFWDPLFEDSREFQR